MREPITCLGEGCGQIIRRPRFNQKYCSEDCKVSLAARQRRAQREADGEAQRWTMQRDADEMFRTEMLPCPFCGGVALAQHQIGEGGPERTYFSCCIGSIEAFGTVEENLKKWNFRVVSNQREQASPGYLVH